MPNFLVCCIEQQGYQGYVKSMHFIVSRWFAGLGSRLMSTSPLELRHEQSFSEPITIKTVCLAKKSGKFVSFDDVVA